MVGHFMLGGTERHVLRVLQGVDRSRVRPFVATIKTGGTWFETFRALDVPLHVIGLEAQVIDPRYWPRLVRLARFVWANRIQVIHAYGWEVQMLACFVRLLCPFVRLVGTRRTVAALEPEHHLQGYRITRRLFSTVVAVSESARRSAIEAEGLEPEQIQVIPNGIEVEALPLRTAQRADGPLRIGTVANVKRRKGYFWAVQGLAELMRRGVEFEYHVVGRNDSAGEFEQSVSELGLAGRVQLHGELAQPLELVAGFDVFLFPTYQEGMSNALLEAMAVGTPVIATAVSGNVDLVRDGEEALLVQPDDVGGLADRLTWAAEHPEGMARLATRARQRALDQFTLQRMLDSMERLYAGLLDD